MLQFIFRSADDGGFIVFVFAIFAEIILFIVVFAGKSG